MGRTPFPLRFPPHAAAPSPQQNACNPSRANRVRHGSLLKIRYGVMETDVPRLSANLLHGSSSDGGPIPTLSCRGSLNITSCKRRSRSRRSSAGLNAADRPKMHSVFLRLTRTSGSSVYRAWSPNPGTAELALIFPVKTFAGNSGSLCKKY